jgi:dipeptidyl-peptidase-4
MKNLFFFLLLIAGFVAVAQKQISVDDFTLRQTFAEKTVSEINWMNDGKFYSALDGNKIIKYDITTGLAVETIVDGDLLTPKISIESYTLSEDETRLLLQTDRQSIYRRSYTAEYYVFDVKNKSLKRLSGRGKQSYATFSPDGSRVAFVRTNNIFAVNLADNTETQITDDGNFNSIINGTTDWVYEEEFGFVDGFYWSGDGKKIAYYRFDESGVKEYNLQKWNKGQLYPQDYKFKYPKAGEANSSIEIWVYDIAGGKKVKADIGTEKDIYIPRVSWTKDPNVLSIRKLNRLQNHLEIIHNNASTGESKVVLSEKSDTYVDIESMDDLTYLANGKEFIYSTESGGYKHLYLYSIDGKLIRQLTAGDFEVLKYYGLDEKTRTIYYTSTEVSPLEQHFYSISLDGKKKLKLSKDAGAHTINMSDDFQFYIDYYSSAAQPRVVSLYQSKGNKLLKVLEKNENLVATATAFGLAPKEFFKFNAADGTPLNGYMLKPKNFDATRKYPLLIYQYSGPGSQNAADKWAGGHYYFHQLLTQRGYIVAVIDTRGTGARGEKFKKLTYKQLGKYELEDIIAGGKYFAALPYIDGARMGVWGWSYGGYMSSLAMTKGNGLFKAGIAVAPVTNWRFYDTIYTERYLQTPQLNPGGYDQNSPLSFPNGLQGKFLLIHGTGDDNVHFQNSVAFEDALIQAGKQFRSFYYPDKTHSIRGGNTQQHLYTMMTDFILENL